MHIYEVKFTNGDVANIDSEKAFEDFLEMISQQEWIEITRDQMSNKWNHYPLKALYQTKSILYVNWDKEEEEYRIKLREKRRHQKLLIEKIKKYKPNFKLKWKYRRNIASLPWFYDANENDNMVAYIDGFLEGVLSDCKKYNCKKVDTE